MGRKRPRIGHQQARGRAEARSSVDATSPPARPLEDLSAAPLRWSGWRPNARRATAVKISAVSWFAESGRARKQARRPEGGGSRPPGAQASESRAANRRRSAHNGWANVAEEEEVGASLAAAQAPSQIHRNLWGAN